MDDKTGKPHRTVFEEFEVTGGQLLDKIRDLIRQGNIRTIRVRAGDGFALELPMTVGALAGGVVMLTAPWLAVLGVIAAMITNVKIEVERDAEAADPQTADPHAHAPQTDAPQTDARDADTLADQPPSAKVPGEPTETDRAIDA